MQTREHLRSERFVDLHHREISFGDAGALEGFGNRDGGTDAHDIGIHTDYARTDQATDPTSVRRLSPASPS